MFRCTHVLILALLQVVGFLDEDGKVWNRNDRSSKGLPAGTQRTVRVLLDPAQYKLDAEAKASGQIDRSVYNTFNIIMKRKAQENNFKAVLECIRDLMNTDIVVPPWLHDVILVRFVHHAHLPSLRIFAALSSCL